MPKNRELVLYYFACSYLEAALYSLHYIDEVYCGNSTLYMELTRQTPLWNGYSDIEMLTRWLVDELYTIMPCEKSLVAVDNELIDDEFAPSWTQLLHDKTATICFFKGISSQISIYCAYCSILLQILSRFNTVAQQLSSSLPANCHTYVQNRPELNRLAESLTQELDRVSGMNGKLLTSGKVEILEPSIITDLALELSDVWQRQITLATEEFAA